jgi:hypothetical protein
MVVPLFFASITLSGTFGLPMTPAISMVSPSRRTSAPKARQASTVASVSADSKGRVIFA